MGLITEYVDMGISLKTIKYYEKLGYDIPKHYNKDGKLVYTIGANIKVKTSDLSPKSSKIIQYKCDNCGKLVSTEYRHYILYQHDGKNYCAACSHTLLNSGINNPNYNINISDEERMDMRQYPEYITFTRKVLARDNYTCQCCKSRNNLQVHHLYSYKSNMELRTNVTNGITLCKECHINFHSKYGKGNNTKQQFLEWLNLSEIELNEYNGTLPACKKVYNYEKNIIYKYGAKEAAEDIGCSIDSVYDCCAGNRTQNKNIKRGHHSANGYHLFWYEEYSKMSEEDREYFGNYPLRRSKKVICLTTGAVFDQIKLTENYYGADAESVGCCCNHRYNYSGKLPNGTKLTWMFYDEYLKQKAS